MDFVTLEQQARVLLDAATFDYYSRGSERQLTLADNTAAWQEITLLPHVLRDVSEVSTATTLLGQEVAGPIAVAPMAMQHLAHEVGPAGMAAAAARASCLLIYGIFGSIPLDQVFDGIPRGPRWMMVYVRRDRDFTYQVVEDAMSVGWDAMVITVDVGRRASGRPDVPDQPVFSAARIPFDTSLTFDDIGLFRDRFGLPVVVKGVLRPDDAVACVQAGASGVVVSNHGGRQLDGVEATARVLGGVVDAVGNSAEVYVDSGIRSGSDALRALALGARATLLGRPALYGLVTAGEEGVYDILEAVRDELEVAMGLCGVRNIAEIDRTLISA